MLQAECFCLQILRLSMGGVSHVADCIDFHGVVCGSGRG